MNLSKETLKIKPFSFSMQNMVIEVFWKVQKQPELALKNPSYIKKVREVVLNYT